MKNKTEVLWIDRKDGSFEEFVMELEDFFDNDKRGRLIKENLRPMYIYINIEVVDTDLFKELFNL